MIGSVRTGSPSDLGTRLDHYDILGLVDAGGMGQVHRARDRKLNRDVAIKVLNPSVAADAARLARFSREAQVLAALNHPNTTVMEPRASWPRRRNDGRIHP